MSRHLSAVATVRLLGDTTGSPAYLGIAEQLRLLIADGRIPPGTRLPSERELTLALGVSRTTVTRAYGTLKKGGYLVARQGSGSVTRLPRPTRLGDTLLNPEPAGPDVIDLTCAAPTAPPGVTAAYEAAVRELPALVQDTGYFPSGLPSLREALARRYDERGLPTDPDQIVVTSGALSGLAVVVRALVPGAARVLLESPTYPNAIGTFRGARTRVLAADIGQSGWATTSLVDAVRQLHPDAAYLMPDFQNPTGMLMTDAERAQLAAALRAERTLTIVDETLAEMALDPVAAPLPFAAHLRETVSIGSASKSFWGGLRIGWLRVPARQMPAVASARLTLDLGAPLVEQLALLRLMERREEILALRREQLTASRAALVAAVSAELPSWRFRLPLGGLSLWCELPRPVSSALVSAADRHGVRLAAGPLFAPEGGLERYLRLPFTHRLEVLTEAVGRIAQVWESGLPARTPRRRAPAFVG